MCGICGTVGIDEPGLIERMVETIHHRGPDDSGIHVDGEVRLGHRRLSIIDLAGGHQPMTTASGALTIVYNGEIYNYRELREPLEAAGVAFETDSDTEVLLRLYEAEGVDALSKLNGMFAFAVWDRRKRELFLARDRVGIKPLYFARLGDKLLFGSETKTILQYDGIARTPRAHAVHDYLALRYAPGPHGMFAEIERLEPGTWMRWRGGRVETGRFWSPPAYDRPERKSREEWLEEVAEHMEASVRRRLISDVSLGAYLSGGLDSSVIVALMSKLTNAPVKTFSVGFDYEHDELTEAEATAKLLGCDHHVVETRVKDFALLPEIVYHADEPLGDAIAIPMYQLAREAKKEVSVILTGEGADEIFGGYLFHKVMWAAGLYRRLTPGFVRRGVVRPLANLAPAATLNTVFKYPAYLGKRGKQKALDYLDVLDRGNQDEGYRHLISLFDPRDTAGLFTPEFEGALQAETNDWEPPTYGDEGSRFDQMLRLQFGHWLPDNMLLRNDKMSMASAIEGRVPFLDHELIDFAFRLPRTQRVRGFTGKYILRRLAERVLPKETARRKKMPFYVPVENYFEQPGFVEMMDDLLGADAVRERGIFRPEAVERLVGSMRRKEFLFVKQVFSLMTLELWYRTFVDRRPAAA